MGDTCPHRRLRRQAVSVVGPVSATLGWRKKRRADEGEGKENQKNNTHTHAYLHSSTIHPSLDEMTPPGAFQSMPPSKSSLEVSKTEDEGRIHNETPKAANSSPSARH
jgi:hypothetical protein